MTYKTYSSYKNSHIDWSSKIPDHWNIQKLKFVSQNMDNKRIPISAGEREEGKYPYYGATGIVDYVKDYIFNEDLLLVGEDGAPFFDNGKNVAFLISGKTWVNNHAHVLKINKSIISDKLVMHSLNCTDYSLYIKGSTRDKLNQEQLKDIPIIVPPKNEQKQITNYLDKQTGKIDATITKNKELIDLLEEKRVALINQRLNDIEFDSIKLKDVLKIGGYIRGPFGSSLKRDELKYEGIPVYEQQHAIHNSREFRYYIDEDKFKELIRFKTLPNDLIISCSGTIGKISIISEEDPIGIISQALLILRIDNNKILPKFLSYFLSSHKGHDYLVSESNGSAQVNISQKDVINKIPIKLPPLNIQKEIVFELENIDSTINKTIHKVQENINLLEEYKTSLIHHVVTGKIDVRGEEI